MSANAIAQALDAMTARFTDMPEKARIQVPAAVSTLKTGLVCQTRGPNGEAITTDMSPAMGGTGTAPNPGWLLRAAMSSCTATVIASRAAQLGITLTELEVSVHGDTDLRGLLGMDPTVSAAITNQVMKVRIASNNASAAVLDEIVHWAESHSPVGCTVCSGNPCTLEVEVLPSSGQCD